jgi:aminoglycoside phosphotransferase (APT) family kinase protein
MKGIIETVDALRRIAPSMTEVFSHADYQPGNVLFHNDRLAGVIDWSDVTLEPREATVAYCRGVLAICPGRDVPQRFLEAYEANLGYRLEIEPWDILYGARGLKGAYGRWPQAFEQLGVPLTGTEIWEASAAWIDQRTTGSARR